MKLNTDTIDNTVNTQSDAAFGSNDPFESNGRDLITGRFTKGNTFSRKQTETEKATTKAKLALIREQVLDSLTTNNNDDRPLAQRVLEATLATKPEAVLKYLEKFALLTLEKEQTNEVAPMINITMPDNVQINT